MVLTLLFGPSKLFQFATACMLSACSVATKVQCTGRLCAACIL